MSEKTKIPVKASKVGGKKPKSSGVLSKDKQLFRKLLKASQVKTPQPLPGVEAQLHEEMHRLETEKDRLSEVHDMLARAYEALEPSDKKE